LSDTDLTPAQASNLRAIQACSSSLSSTISHVLAFAKTTGQSLQVRSDGSQRPIDSAEVEVHAFVEEAVGQTFVRSQYGTRARGSPPGALDEFFDPATAAIDAGGLYDTTGPPQTMLQCLLDFRGSPVAVLVDAIALRRIIINLVSNASVLFTSVSNARSYLR
jgi:signal transduction histidine kinase